IKVTYAPAAAGQKETATLTVGVKKPPPAAASIKLTGASNSPPSANPDHFSMKEDDAGGGTISLGNLLANDTDPDGDSLVVASVQSLTFDTTHASSVFSGMTAQLKNGGLGGGEPATVTLTLNGHTATVTIASGGTVKVSDPNNLFNQLGANQSVVINA